MSVRLAYTMTELRDMLPKGPRGKGYDEKTVTRWLRRHQVPLDRIGRDNVVWLADLIAAFPQFERSLEALRGVDDGE